MRWSIIRLIWVRELRDQLRDRRTMFMVVVLPLLLYPVLGFAVLRFALGVVDRQTVIGIERIQSGAGGDFPEAPPQALDLAPKYLAYLALTPASTFPEGVVGATALAAAPRPQYFPLLHIQNGKAVLVGGKKLPNLEKIDPADGPPTPELILLAVLMEKTRFEFLDPQAAKEALADKRIDILISASPDFYTDVKNGETKDRDKGQAAIKVQTGVPQERYRIAKNRLDHLLDFWKKEMINQRLAQRQLPRHFDEPFVADEDVPPNISGGQPERILNMMVRIFPFMLVMWSLAGALYPAVDLCAGEKERGTMETLLISPAGREEIVIGKFLTIWMFSGGTAMLNLFSMGLSTWLTTLQAPKHMPLGSFPLTSLLWCMVLLLPLSAFFSAISLAVGAYARSTKEGQYYLMPLFLITMPLMFLTLAPGVELNPFYSLVPVTGAALLMQKLMTATALAQIPWLYFVPVLAPIVLYSYLALRWAIAQFHREEVLFREAERLDLMLWFRRLFREKEATPSTGQAFFIFSLVLALHWLSLSIGQQLPLVTHTAIRLLAFVATPPLFFTMMLNTKPLLGLRLKWPQLREIGLAALLAVLLLPPVAYVSVEVLTNYPHVARLLERQPLVEELRNVIEGRPLNDAVPYLLGLALLPALAEELCFRGFLLSGMLKTFRPRTAVLLVSFMFALYHMNVFLFLPAFIVGVVLGLLTLRSRSLVPAFVFHLLFKTVLIVGVHIYGRWREEEEIPSLMANLWLPGTAVFLAIAVVLLWRLYRAPYRAGL